MHGTEKVLSQNLVENASTLECPKKFFFSENKEFI